MIMLNCLKNMMGDWVLVIVEKVASRWPDSGFTALAVITFD